jgi:choline dehydrogenase-like flavoprotein
VLHDAPVTGIAFSEPSANSTGYNNTTALPRAIGVSYIEQSVGFVRQAKAKKEVIISMGAFQSPQMLMVSVSSFHTRLNASLTLFRALDLNPSLRRLASSLWYSMRMWADSKIPIA